MRLWQDPATRTAWVEALAQRALASLPQARWQVRHPTDWPEGERQTLAARLRSTPEWQPDGAVRAGLCLCAGGARQGDSDPLRAAPARGVPAASGSKAARTGEKARVGSYACLDGTLDGLLADRAAVEAALLAAMEEVTS